MAMVLKPIVPPIEVVRWRLDQYHEMVAKGFLGEDDAVELLEGWIVPKMPHNPDRDLTIEDVEDQLSPLLPKEWKLRIQSALSIPNAESEPEPDLTVCVRQQHRRRRHPRPSDTAMVGEVSDSSLRRDRTVKLRMYASGRIPIYWIINLDDRQVEVYADPIGSGDKARYRRKRFYRNGDQVPVVIAGKEIGRIPASRILPS